MTLRLHIARERRGWAVRRDGAKRAWRVFGYRDVAEREAMIYAFGRIRAESRLTGWRLFVHALDGTIDDCLHGGRAT